MQDLNVESLLLKLPGLDAVSFGPQMEHIHTTNEVLSISSTERTWELGCETFGCFGINCDL